MLKVSLYWDENKIERESDIASRVHRESKLIIHQSIINSSIKEKNCFHIRFYSVQINFLRERKRQKALKSDFGRPFVEF